MTVTNVVGVGDSKELTRFPYFGLDDAERTVQIIHREYGGECATDQLAAALDSKLTSGAFRSRASALAQFGLVKTGGGRISLTPLGRAIVDQSRQKKARVAAFLNVPLYRAVYERFRGSTLPTDDGLERVMEREGVTANQTDRARQAFQRSARHAGFFAHGPDRLVQPPLGSTGAAAEPVESKLELPLIGAAKEERRMPPTQEVSFPNPLIQGLFLQLPDPDTAFDQAAQTQWLELAKVILATVWRTRLESGAATGVPSTMSTEDTDGTKEAR
ncbi:MAG: hypothetical protein WD651_11660 [Acidimicrobiia bacterium]